MIKVYIALNKLLFISGILLFFNVSNPNAQQTDSTSAGYMYFINSNPFNAEVYHRDSLLGLTPLRFISEYKLSGNILIRKKNYKEVYFSIGEYDFSRGVEIMLVSILPVAEKIVIKDKRTGFIRKRSFIKVITSGILAVTTGTLAYTTKEKANDFYNHYLSDRSQGNLDKANKYDLYSGISLAVMQISVAGLIYFLFLE